MGVTADLGTALGRSYEEETIWAAGGVLRYWIEHYGVPRALYTDWKNVYVRPPQSAGTVAQRTRRAAVQTHVREAGSSHYRSQFTAGQGWNTRMAHQDRLHFLTSSWHPE